MLNRNSDPDAANPPDLLPLADSLGELDYQIQGRLPTDSKMSEILLATDRRQRPVVLKIACVQQRARAAANRRAIHNSVDWLQPLRAHPGIARLQPIQRKGQSGPRSWFTPPTFVGTLPNWPENPDFLVTEYLTGGTLNSFVGKRRLPLPLAVGIAHDLAQTLAYLHAHACVHRDLKPENILFRVAPNRTDPPGTIQPVLIDFGVAARAGEAKLIAGSRLWMAPELQAADDKALLPVDPAWDVYALGLICCYMITGLRPQRRQYAYQDYIDYRTHVFALLQQEEAGTDGVTRQTLALLQQSLERALAREAQQRPTAAEFAANMAQVFAALGVTLPTPTPDWQTGLRHWRQSLRGLSLRWALIGLAILVVGLTSFLLLSANPKQQPQLLASAPPPTTPAATAVMLPATSTSLPTAMAQAAIVPVLAEASATTAPPPTLAPLPATATDPIPTLAALEPPPVPPPTLIAFTPTALPTATPVPPTATATASPTQLPPTATALATATTIPTATRQPTPAFGTIQLLTPATNGAAAQERVEFAWQLAAGTLATNHCYELVFWDPNKPSDKRSPIGAGRTNKGTVTFSKLRESPDTLLRTLARSPAGFDWGVRFVDCTSPRTILQDVSDSRHYTYQP